MYRATGCVAWPHYIIFCIDTLNRYSFSVRAIIDEDPTGDARSVVRGNAAGTGTSRISTTLPKWR
ncbi:hypothetical protein BO443_80222 [Burkholderia orbicola]